MEPIVKATIQACVLSAISNILAQIISGHRAGVSQLPCARQAHTDVGVQHYTLDTAPLVNFVAYSLLSCPPNYLWQSWLESTFPGYTSPDEPGTVSNIAQQPLVKSATDAAGPALERIEKTAAPALQSLEEKASAATSALADTDVVKNARRRASEGVDTVKAKTKELEARAGFKPFLSKPPTRAQTFSTADGQVVEKEVQDTRARVSPTAASSKKLNVKNTAIKFALDQTLGAVVNNAMFVIGIGFLKGQSVDVVMAALYRVCPSLYLYPATPC